MTEPEVVDVEADPTSQQDDRARPVDHVAGMITPWTQQSGSSPRRRYRAVP
jgi:hypothetical protein